MDSILRGVTATVPLLACAAVEAQTDLPAGYDLIYEQDFEGEDALDDWIFSDPNAWSPGSEEGRTFLELTGESDYRPPHRSPLHIALLDDLVLGDFILELEARQTGREYGHRDLCLFFAFESPTRFYYAHLATTPDDRAHNLFLVEDAPRRRIAPVQERGVDWGQRWHRLRLERHAGRIRVFFDDMKEPVLEAPEAGLGDGRVGVGSFDDSGRFTKMRLWAPESRQPPTPNPFR